MNAFVRITDYMANTRIVKKNSILLEVLADNYLPELEKNQSHFRDILAKIDANLRTCYNLSTAAA